MWARIENILMLQLISLYLSWKNVFFGETIFIPLYKGSALIHNINDQYEASRLHDNPTSLSCYRWNSNNDWALEFREDKIFH